MERKNSLLKYAEGYKWLTVISCVLSGISSALSIVPFVCIYNIIKYFILNNQSDEIIRYGEIAVLTSIISIGLYFIALSLGHIAAFRVAKNLKTKACNHIIDMPLGYFEMKSTGELRKTIDENTMLTEDFLAHKLPDFAATLIMPIVIVISFFFYDWRMGIVCFIPLLIAFFCIHKMMGGENKFTMGKIMTLQEQMNKEAVEYVRGIPIIKVFQQTVFSFKKFHDTILSYRDLVTEYSKKCRLPKTVFTVTLNSFFIFLLVIGIIVFNVSSNKAGVFLNLIFFILIAPLISTTMMRLMMTGENLIQAKEALIRIESIIYNETKNNDGVQSFPDKHDIKFKNVSFSYPDHERKVLDNINLKIKERSKVAFVGLSGSGKSTIISLIGKFFEVKDGEITIGDRDIKKIKTEELMKNISFVFQDSKLFEMSILDNIRIGKKDASEMEVKKALKIAQCESVIEKLPFGLESVYGTKGVYLSGGERQRIALARAFIKDSPIIIFDEATSATDAENEYYITKAIEEISKNKTVILVAHRLSTIQDVDEIIVMDKGKIVEQGNHNTLIKEGNQYAKMWNQYVGSTDWRL